MSTIKPRENDVAGDSSAFSDPEAVFRYAEGAKRSVPSSEAVQRMTTLLIAERAPQDAWVLVLGSGLEMKVFMDAHPGWTLEGVDSSAQMLALANSKLGPQAPRAQLRLGAMMQRQKGPLTRATAS